MSIRCSSKAILIKDGRLLLCRCRDRGAVYYDLPGGGQHPFEPMEEALRREVMEETGYSIQILRLIAVTEEIYDDPHVREHFPEYAHRMLHVFLAEVSGEPQREISEPDYQMETVEWFTPQEADALPVRPSTLCGRFSGLIASDSCLYLGAARFPAS